jgi:predicted TIM-barrel fold metal-dependent hydrolase
LLIDAAVHPSFARDADLREFLDTPWKHRSFAPADSLFHPSPRGDYLESAWPEQGLPGSSRELVEEHLFERLGVDIAVLLPLTRGINLDIDLNSAICEATNNWQAEVWLGDDRFRGTIRVNPGDPDCAVDEIERWSDDSRMTQVGVPMSSLLRYGHRSMFKIWEAAARRRLPVAVVSDGVGGSEFDSSPVGDFRHFVEVSCFAPHSFHYHLASLITGGVFDRLDDLVFIFVDGGGDQVMPLIWRLDADWRACQDDHPWAHALPSSYLPRHVRFVSNRMEGPLNPDQWPRWLELSGAADLLLYGSRYPRWSFATPADVLPDGALQSTRERVLWRNAADLFGIGAHAS